MGALTLRKLSQHKDNIDITTTEVLENPDGSVAKRSMVHVNAVNNRAGTDLWIGLKIQTRQEVGLLRVEGKTWISRRKSPHPEAQKQFKRLFPPKAGEKWVAYLVDGSDIPIRFTFETELKLSHHVVEYPDAQTVAIVVCYMPAEGNSILPTDVLLGHSLVQAPPPKHAKTSPRKVRR